tara:strand:- start:250 stop:522 length:273 start_codon:yes stop_codon:yes gene_type:complete
MDASFMVTLGWIAAAVAVGAIMYRSIRNIKKVLDMPEELAAHIEADAKLFQQMVDAQNRLDDRLALIVEIGVWWMDTHDVKVPASIRKKI